MTIATINVITIGKATVKNELDKIACQFIATIIAATLPMEP